MGIGAGGARRGAVRLGIVVIVISVVDTYIYFCILILFLALTLFLFLVLILLLLLILFGRLGLRRLLMGIVAAALRSLHKTGKIDRAMADFRSGGSVSWGV